MSPHRLHPDARRLLRGDPRPFVRLDDPPLALPGMRLAVIIISIIVSAMMWVGMCALALMLARMVTG